MGLQLPRTGWEAILTPAEFQAWRERLGITRAQAAAALGMSLEYIRSAETGRLGDEATTHQTARRETGAGEAHDAH